MKRIYSLLMLIILFMLSGCMQKECIPQIKEVVRTTEKIKEVEVPVVVEKYVEVPVYEKVDFRYKPGSYYKTKEADGFTYMAFIHINKAGLIDNIFVDKSSHNILFYKDSMTNDLYVKVKGLEDVIPNTYRLIRDNLVPTIDDAITTFDLIEGYPQHDKIIERLVPIESHNTKQTDALIYHDNWASEMKLVTDKIIADQTTAAINLYNSSSGTKTDNIRGVTINIGHEISLINEILRNEAKLTSEVSLEEAKKNYQGLYKSGTYFDISTPVIVNGKLKYDSSLVFVNNYGFITNIFLNEFSSEEDSKLLTNDKKWQDKASEITKVIIANQGLNGFKYLDSENNEVVTPSLKVKENNYEALVYLNKLEFNGLYEAITKTLKSAYNNFNLVSGNYYFRSKEGIIYSVIIRNIVTKAKGSYKVGDIISGLDLKSTPHELKIIGFTMDRLLQDKESFYLIDGKEVELYTYHKAYPIYTKKDDYDVVTIYKEKNKNGFYYLDTDISNNIIKDEKVKFDNKYFDEEATLKKETSFVTLRTALGLTSSEKEELDLYNKISEKILEDNNLLTVLMDMKGKALNLDTKLNLSNIKGDLFKLQMLASNGINAASNISDPHISFDNKELADGSYYALEGNKDYSNYAQMLVYNNKIVSLMVDEIKYYEEGKVNIFNSQISDNLFKLSGVIGSEEVNINDLIKDFDYKSSAKLDYSKTLYTKDMAKYDVVVKTLIEEALKAKLSTSVNKLDLLFKDLTTKEYLVPTTNSSFKISKRSIDEIFSFLGSNKYELSFKPSRNLKLNETSTDYIFIYDNDKIKSDSKELVEYEFNFDDFEAKGSFEIEVLMISTLHDKILNYDLNGKTNRDYIIEDYEAVLENVEVKIDLLPEAKLLTSNLEDGFDNFNVVVKLDNVTTTVPNKTVFSGPKTLKFNLVDKTRTGHVSLRIFYDLNEDDHQARVWQKDENYLDIDFDVYSIKDAKDILKDTNHLKDILNYVSSEKPIRLESSKSLPVKGIEVNYTQSVKDLDKISNNRFGFINLETGDIHDTYQDGDYYQVDLPLDKPTEVKLVASFKEASTSNLIKTYEYNFKVKRGDTKELEEAMSEAIKYHIREQSKANIYPNLEYRYLEKDKLDTLFFNGKRLDERTLNQFVSIPVINPISGKEVTVSIEWINDKNLPISDISRTFEEVILSSISAHYPLEEEIVKTKLVAKAQYRIDEISVTTYVDFNFNIYNNGIKTE